MVLHLCLMAKAERHGRVSPTILRSQFNCWLYSYSDRCVVLVLWPSNVGEAAQCRTQLLVFQPYHCTLSRLSFTPRCMLSLSPVGVLQATVLYTVYSQDAHADTVVTSVSYEKQS